MQYIIHSTVDNNHSFGVGDPAFHLVPESLLFIQPVWGLTSHIYTYLTSIHTYSPSTDIHAHLAHTYMLTHDTMYVLCVQGSMYVHGSVYVCAGEVFGFGLGGFSYISHPLC